MTPGASPGLLIPLPDAVGTVIDVVGFSPSDIVEKKNVTVQEVVELRERCHCLWVDVHGLKDVQVIEQLGTEFEGTSPPEAGRHATRYKFGRQK